MEVGNTDGTTTRPETNKKIGSKLTQTWIEPDTSGTKKIGNTIKIDVQATQP